MINTKKIKEDCELIKSRIEKNIKIYELELKNLRLIKSYSQTSIIERNKYESKIEALKEIQKYLIEVKGIQ